MTIVRGRNILRSLMAMLSGKMTEIIPFFSTTWASLFPFRSFVEILGSFSGRPLWIHKAIAMMVKFTAMSMALGR